MSRKEILDKTAYGSELGGWGGFLPLESTLYISISFLPVPQLHEIYVKDLTYSQINF